MTQLESARKGIITDCMKQVAEDEKLDPETLRQFIAEGVVVIPANIHHTNRRYYGIGKPLRVKINANIGTSPQNTELSRELEKLKMVEELDAESVMDLSIAGDLDAIRQTIIENAGIMVGTVPIYQILTEHHDAIEKIDLATILATIEKHGKQGVDFITVHCGLTRAALPLIEKRLMGVVSRGGSFIASWMLHHGKENPLYTHYDEIIAIARKYDMTLSLGDGLRPGALADATDEAQLHELHVLGELTERAQKAGVQVMVEGPGHVPFNQIEKNVRLQQEICHQAPFYVLGPLTTDRAPGYDHITGAIGGTLAAYCGASFLCYVTPAEHLRLPSVADVREGVIASKIAAHSADIAKGNQAAIEKDRAYARMRKDFDWKGMFEHAIDPVKPMQYRKASTNPTTEECSMCGDYCAIKMLDKKNAKKATCGKANRPEV
jgi:phosphomethylpyrimidine synthase